MERLVFFLRKVFFFPDRRFLIRTKFSRQQVIGFLSDHYTNKEYGTSNFSGLEEAHFHLLRDHITIKKVYRVGRHRSERYDIIAEGPLRIISGEEAELDLRLYFHQYAGAFFMPVLVSVFILALLYFLYTCIFETAPRTIILPFLFPVTVLYFFYFIKGRVALRSFEQEIRKLFE